jgi:sugar (pentulose or hexulose) kinase
MTALVDTYLIGLDLGTTGLKGVLVDRRGRVKATRCVATEFDHPRDGWVEMSPERHFESVCTIVRELAGEAPGEVSAMAMAGATGNTLLTDSDGTPLTPILSWMDRRCEHEKPKALSDMRAEAVARVTGWPCVSTFPLAHLAWLRENTPDIYRNAGHIGMVADWLLHKFTGKWRMDHSTATTFHLQNQVGGVWHEPFMRMLDIDPQQLSALCGAGIPVGRLSEDAAEMLGLTTRTLVVSGSFDHPAAARAAGVLAPGQLLLSCGTSWVGFLPHSDRDALLAAGLLCDPFLTEDGGPWGGMFSVPYIGRAVEWYVTQVIAPGAPDPWDVFTRAAADANPGADGLEIDLRETPRAPDAARHNVARAAMEGAARLLAEKLASLRAHGFDYDEAVMVGGPSDNEVWTSILADVTGLRLTTGGRSAGARGAAMLAGIGAGWYPDEAAALSAWRNTDEN